MCTSLHGKAVSAHPITKVAPTPLTELYALAGADVGKAAGVDSTTVDTAPPGCLHSSTTG